MTNENIKWMQNAKTAAKRFIQIYCPEEILLFDSLWETLSPKILIAIDSSHLGQLTVESAAAFISDYSIASGNNLGLLSTAIAGTFIETSFIIDSDNPNENQLKEIIASVAARHGAKQSLTACLVKELPKLFNSISYLDLNAPQALIEEVPRPMYMIWTQGCQLNVNNEVFDDYIKKKKNYLFWVNLVDKKNYSHIAKGKHIGLTAIKLLKYLVESLGSRKAVSDVLMQIFNDEDEDIEISTDRKFKIDRQLSNLNAYSGGKFRGYIFAEKFTKGIGLRRDFADKYFLYEQLR